MTDLELTEEFVGTLNYRFGLSIKIELEGRFVSVPKQGEVIKICIDGYNFLYNVKRIVDQLDYMLL